MSVHAVHAGAERNVCYIVVSNETLQTTTNPSQTLLTKGQIIKWMRKMTPICTFVSITCIHLVSICVFLIKSTILDISLSYCIHELYYRYFTCTCLLCDKQCLYWTVSTKFQNARRARAAVNRQGYFRICCLILKKSCSHCNYLEKIQC